MLAALEAHGRAMFGMAGGEAAESSSQGRLRLAQESGNGQSLEQDDEEDESESDDEGEGEDEDEDDEGFHTDDGWGADDGFVSDSEDERVAGPSAGKSPSILNTVEVDKACEGI
jgi:hypothetical protein